MYPQGNFLQEATLWSWREGVRAWGVDRGIELWLVGGVLNRVVRSASSASVISIMLVGKKVVDVDFSPTTNINHSQNMGSARVGRLFCIWGWVQAIQAGVG